MPGAALSKGVLQWFSGARWRVVSSCEKQDTDHFLTWDGEEGTKGEDEGDQLFVLICPFIGCCLYVPDRDQTHSLGVSVRAIVPFQPCHETGFPFVLIGSWSDGLFGGFKFKMLLLLNDCLHCLKGKIDGDCSWAQRGPLFFKTTQYKTRF